MEHPEDPKQRVSHETIYPYIYTHPAGELKKLLLEALRQGRGKRKPRSRGKDRRGGGVRRGPPAGPASVPQWPAASGPGGRSALAGVGALGSGTACCGSRSGSVPARKPRREYQAVRGMFQLPRGKLPRLSEG